MKSKLLFVVNVDWAFLSHRLPIGLEALKQGYEVHIASSITDRLRDLQDYGFIVHPIYTKRGSSNILVELFSFFNILKVIFVIRPDVIHLVTLKPILYGGIAARLASKPAVLAAVPGLGYIFLSEGWLAKLRFFFVKRLYRIALKKRNTKVVFQNPHDLEILTDIAGLSPDNVKIIPGSGVDLSLYKVEPLSEGVPVVIMAARLLYDKGVGEFVAAARLLKDRNVNVKFWLVGKPDPGNPTTVKQKELNSWREEGCVEILGYRRDINDLYAKATVIALPSYREGLPKSLIEAAACGRAVVTTDQPGCRDAIEPEKSGLMVPVRDVRALADAIQFLIKDRELCRRMGKNGRALAVRKFDIKKIVETHMQIYKELEEDL